MRVLIKTVNVFFALFNPKVPRLNVSRKKSRDVGKPQQTSKSTRISRERNNKRPKESERVRGGGSEKELADVFRDR